MRVRKPWSADRKQAVREKNIAAGGFWTADRCAIAKKMWGDGATQTAIATELGGTKGQVAGFIFRERLSRRGGLTAFRKRMAATDVLRAIVPAHLPALPPPSPPVCPEPLPLPYRRGRRNNTKVLCGGDWHPIVLPRGHYTLEPFRIHCSCGHDWMPSHDLVRHNVYTFECQNYTIDCPWCWSSLIVCGYERPSAKSVENVVEAENV